MIAAIRIMAMAAGLALVSLTACTQMPTEKQSISDMRPQLSFKFSDERMATARVLVDGLDMGIVGDFKDGTASLRILSGMHVVRVELSGQLLIEERIYAGDGVNRTILVK